MNHIMPMRNEVSTCLLYMPTTDSRMTVPNQPNIMNTRIARPTNISGFAVSPLPSLNQFAAPITVLNSPMEPTIGQWLPCGT